MVKGSPAMTLDAIRVRAGTRMIDRMRASDITISPISNIYSFPSPVNPASGGIAGSSARLEDASILAQDAITEYAGNMRNRIEADNANEN
jgi:hypothetical protein